MAFKLAEAFVELKARGEKELHKSLEKTKGKVEEIGPATEQAEKRIEKAVTDAAKGIEKAGDKMGAALQKPIDKLAEFEKEMKGMFDSARGELKKLDTAIKTSDSAGGPFGSLLGGNRAIFGRFAGAAQIGAGGALVGLGAAVGMRMNELQTTGGDSELLGREISAMARDLVTGMKELVARLKEAGTGFVDAFVGMIALVANQNPIGRLVMNYGRSATAATALEEAQRRDRIRAIADRDEINKVDAFAPIRALEQRQRIDAIFKQGGIGGLERAAGELAPFEFADLEKAQELRDINERIAQEKERAAKAGEAAAIAAEREAEAFREGGRNATWAPGRQLDIMREAWRTGRPAESIDAERRWNLGPEDVARMEARMRGVQQFTQAGRDADAVKSFADRLNDRMAALADEGDEVKKLTRAYREFQAVVAAMPEGPPKEAAKRRLGDIGLSIDAIGALTAEQENERARRQKRRDESQAAGDKRIDAIRRRFDDEQFAAGNKPRDTAQFRVVDIADLARQLQSDIFAKEDEQLRIEEEKKMHEEAQKKRDEMVQAINAVKEEVKNQVAKFN